jgi:hypothetical protein
MPRVGFEPSIAVFDWAKTIHAVDGGATVIDSSDNIQDRKNIREKTSEVNIRPVEF